MIWRSRTHSRSVGEILRTRYGGHSQLKKNSAIAFWRKIASQDTFSFGQINKVGDWEQYQCHTVIPLFCLVCISMELPILQEGSLLSDELR